MGATGRVGGRPIRQDAYRFALEKTLTHLNAKFSADGGLLAKEQQQAAARAITDVRDAWGRGGDLHAPLGILRQLAWQLPPQSVTVVNAHLEAITQWAREVSEDGEGELGA